MYNKSVTHNKQNTNKRCLCEFFEAFNSVPQAIIVKLNITEHGSSALLTCSELASNGRCKTQLIVTQKWIISDTP